MKLWMLLLFSLVPTYGAPLVSENVKEIDTNNVELKEVKQTNNPTIPQEEPLQIQSMEEIMEINRKCLQESGLEKDILNNLKETHSLPPSSEKYLKFLACSYKLQKYENQKGEVQYKNIKKFLSSLYKKEDLTVLDKCGSIKQTSDGGQNAYNTLTCIWPKLLLLKEIRDI